MNCCRLLLSGGYQVNLLYPALISYCLSCDRKKLLTFLSDRSLLPCVKLCVVHPECLFDRLVGCCDLRTLTSSPTGVVCNVKLREKWQDVILNLSNLTEADYSQSKPSTPVEYFGGMFLCEAIWKKNLKVPKSIPENLLPLKVTVTALFDLYPSTSKTVVLKHKWMLGLNLKYFIKVFLRYNSSTTQTYS